MQRKSASVLRDPRAVIFLTGVFLMAVVFYQHEGAMPLFLVRDLHYRESFYGILFAVNTVLIVFLEVPLNLAMQRWSHRWTLVLGATLFAVGFGSMAVLHSVPGLLLAAVVWTFGEMIAMPASGAYAADIAPRGRGGQYAGAYASAFSGRSRRCQARSRCGPRRALARRACTCRRSRRSARSRNRGRFRHRRQ